MRASLRDYLPALAPLRECEERHDLSATEQECAASPIMAGQQFPIGPRQAWATTPAGDDIRSSRRGPPREKT